ncbi:hypothetical protein J3Q64DRAFT_1856299, partial [Phycomyces blakesleeanus]
MNVTPGQAHTPAFRRGTEKIDNQRISFLGMTVQQVKAELITQADEHDRTLATNNLQGISKSALLKQSSEIRQSILELDKLSDHTELPPATLKRLEATVNESYNMKGGLRPSPFDTDVTRLLPSAPAHTSPSKQRSKTIAQGRKHADIEFATEIGQGLLNEVRKLQSALQERDETIKQLEIAKSETERDHELITKRLKQHDNAKERLKESNWNLEMANQELQAHLREANQTSTRVNAEYSRLVKQCTASAEQVEHLKAQEEKARTSIDTLRSRHEQDI